MAFERVNVQAVACGDLRGSGQDVYVAYWPPAGRAPAAAGTVVLAGLHRAEGTFTNIDLPWPYGDLSTDRLWLQDATGDGRPDLIVWTGAPAGSDRRATAYVIWS